MAKARRRKRKFSPAPAGENVTAVKDGKILNLQNNELSRPGPRLADGAKAMYDFVYGE